MNIAAYCGDTGLITVGTEKMREKVDSYRMRSDGSIYMEWDIWSIPDQQCYVVVNMVEHSG